jgi:hypothetical protein
MGLTVVSPPSSEASRIEALRDLWTRAGLDEVETREITVQRTFPDFEDFWTTSLLTPSARPTIAAMAPNDIELLKERVCARLPADATGHITYSARANAVKGRVPNQTHNLSPSPDTTAQSLYDVRYSPKSGHSRLRCIRLKRRGRLKGPAVSQDFCQ